MISLKNKQSGFTIVELLIVIVVIGILAALVVTTFNGIQQKGRDTERETDIKAIHGQLEAYYAQNNTYPLLADVNDTTWRGTNMKGLDNEALRDPKAATGVFTLGSAPAIAVYSYQVFESNGTTNCTVAANCAKYTLTATLEGQINNSSTYVKSSLN
jgi:prepilin-type N-terminal cleavage/methylation domain-containing protein